MSKILYKNENGEFVELPFLKGEKGDTPVKGTDYFTTEDIETIVNAVYEKIEDGSEVAY